MLRAVGFKDDDFRKPQVGIASTWSNLTPCNMHIDKLAQESAAGADDAGGKSLTFNTITVSDGIANGTEGMKYSLVSREVIADSIETVAGCEGFDGLVAIGGCDKNMPGCMMGLARLNRPSVFVYGGTIMPGENHTDIISVFEAVGAHARGDLDLIQVKQIEETAIPGPGSCGGMYTANTMASAIEAMGMSLPGSSAQNAISDSKAADCRAAGAAVLNLLEKDIKPSDVMTREAFENAITVVIALGGSTNAVLHLIAMASTIGVELTLDDFVTIGKRVPVLADLRPSGHYMMSELVAIGGIQPLMKMLLDRGLLHGGCLTVTGKTLAENLAEVDPYPEGQDIIHACSRQDHRERRYSLHRPCPGVSFGGRSPGTDYGRHRSRRRRSGYPLRGPERRSWYAGNADAHLCDYGKGAGQRRGADYRWPVFRWQPRFRGRPYHAGSG
jgi:dihydroxy-acid dehydratase